MLTAGTATILNLPRPKPVQAREPIMTALKKGRPVELKSQFENQLWVEPVGNLVIARLRGSPTAELLEECQRRVMVLVRETGFTRAIYDALEMEAPSVEVVLAQRNITDREEAGALRRAIVVPNSKLAYLARMAFGEGDYRVFYSDMTNAIRWLGGEGQD